MIITRDQIHNKITMKLEATNSNLMDIGIDAYDGYVTRRDQIIYLDFITTQLPDILRVQLIDAVSNSPYLTQEGLEFCEINLLAATLQETPPDNGGDKESYVSALSGCLNKYDYRGIKSEEGLAIVQSDGVYHIYYMLHNPVHLSGANGKFGSGYILYDSPVAELYITEDTRIDKSLKIGSKIQIGANGLQNISNSNEQIAFDFGDEDGVKCGSEWIEVRGERHSNVVNPDYFTFTDTLSSEQKKCLSSHISVVVGYQGWMGSGTSRNYFADRGSGTGSHGIELTGTPGTSDKTFDVECDKVEGLIARLYMNNSIEGARTTEGCTIEYLTKGITKVVLSSKYSGTLYFHRDKYTSELGESGKTYSLQDSKGELGSVYGKSGSPITLTPTNKNLPEKYKPTFSEFYSMVGSDVDLIPILSPIKLTANYHEGEFLHGAIVVEADSTVKYYAKGANPSKKVLVLAYVDVNE